MDDLHEISNITYSGSKSLTLNTRAFFYVFSSACIEVLLSLFFFHGSKIRLLLKRAVRSGSKDRVNDKSSDCREMSTVKPVLSGKTKIDKTKVLKTNSNLIKVESNAECSLQYF